MVGVMVEFPYHASSGIPVLNYKLATEGQEGNTKLEEKCSILTLVLNSIRHQVTFYCQLHFKSVYFISTIMGSEGTATSLFYS